MGQWVLQDKTENNVNKTHRWGAGKEFDIIESHEKLRYTAGSMYSYVHYSDKGEFYIRSNWEYGTIKRLKIFNDRLYLYVLIYDNWILDPIHKWGEYFYVKHPPRELFIP